MSNITNTLSWRFIKEDLKSPNTRGISVDPNNAIGIGYVIYADTWNSIVDKAQAAARYCSCHCNYCTCNCNYCNCNCNYCRCACNYCTCNCNHRCVCNCNY